MARIRQLRTGLDAAYENHPTAGFAVQYVVMVGMLVALGAVLDDVNWVLAATIALGPAIGTAIAKDWRRKQPATAAGSSLEDQRLATRRRLAAWAMIAVGLALMALLAAATPRTWRDAADPNRSQVRGSCHGPAVRVQEIRDLQAPQFVPNAFRLVLACPAACFCLKATSTRAT